MAVLMGSCSVVLMGFWSMVLLGLSSALLCPDGGMCEDNETCCWSATGGYGCCPLPHAECCSDHLHCCYEGTLCDLVHQKCVNKTVSLPWVRRLPTRHSPPQLEGRVTAVMCPDHESECPDDTTCCQLPDSSWGCCPLPKAVCCEDKRHCCPEGTECDLVHAMCVSPSLGSFPLLEKLPARRAENKPAAAVSVICPGGKSSCPDAYTCCPLTSGDYGCCPYPDATCCSDHLHCCPSNTICDLEHGVCRSAEVLKPLMRIASVSTDIVCPDRKSICPDQTTCCLMTNGTYGCCPMPDAVCCSDHIHCCPADTQCDLEHSTCVSAQKNTPVLKVLAAVKERSRAAVVPCNDSVACADGNTCCKSPGGRWACCPLAQAVCCEDHRHCCPHGTSCNLKASSCDPLSGNPLPLISNVPASPLLAENTRCDESTSCPGEATCCKTASGQWACCPLPKAVCCDDHVHCCPHGSVCNVEADTCDDPSGFLPSRRWQVKVPALTWKHQDEKCDEQTLCPRGTTCCRTESGLWACCPLPQAVCCSDQQHCCPRGFRCNVSEQTCDRPGHLSVPWLQKVPVLQNQPSLVRSGPTGSDRITCDPQTSCPKDTTCCFMEKSKSWGCCPLPEAVCCEDGNHCCPNGHTCEPHQSSCSRGLHTIAWFTKLRARTDPSDPTDLSDVRCDDKSSCASGTTCCRLQGGEWGCCPLVKAVCCDDHEHCCPQGYSCNMKTATCEKKSRPQSGPSQDNGDVPCDESARFYCSKQQTCCRTSNSEWSCCPAQQAVCCSDSERCCPAGFSCDLKAGGCTRTRTRTWI